MAQEMGEVRGVAEGGGEGVEGWGGGGGDVGGGGEG